MRPKNCEAPGFNHGAFHWYALRAEALRLLALADDPVRDPVAAAALR